MADFSTNVHPLGPCPGTLRALARADRRLYPDPDYLALRDRLASHHGVDADRIVVGAGASELIHRIVSALPGTVLVRDPTFVEYRKSAAALDREILRARDDREFLEALPSASVAFLCHPNNPDGRLHAREFLDEAAELAVSNGTELVLDLAYAPMCDADVHIPPRANQLWAPNKPMDCAGVRAGYLVASDARCAARLAKLAPSWILSAEGVELLSEFAHTDTRAWLDSSRPQVVGLRRKLSELLTDRNWEVREGQANFVVARPPPPNEVRIVCASLRSRGIRVRDAANMGMPGWIRLAARPQAELDALATALD